MTERIQNTVLKIQAELEKLQSLIQTALDEHKIKQKHIDVSTYALFYVLYYA